MGKAKRRKQLDPNFGKPRPKQPERIIEGLTESQWQNELGLTKPQWNLIKNHFQVVHTRDEINTDIDGI